jgi:hypothetical protein
LPSTSRALYVDPMSVLLDALEDEEEDDQR